MRGSTDTIELDSPLLGGEQPHARKGVTCGSGGEIGLNDRVMALQSQMMAMTEHHIQIVPVHRFAHGLYAREVTLPAGSTAVGYRHAQEHIVVLSKGRVQIVTEGGTVEVAAPATMIVPAGRKNCVHALEETVWTTVHASAAATVEEAEAALILPDAEDFKCLS